MIEKVTYSRVFLIISLLLICIQGKAIQQCDSASLALMEGTWREFREIHPFGFQTVALKHRGDTCVFVMSEPSECVKSEVLEKLFTEYGGHLIIGRQPFGYDGALYDAIGCAVLDSVKFKGFESRLFRCLYGTPYKPYYTDLDDPSPHVYFSDINMNYDLSRLDWRKWRKNIVFSVDGQEKTLEELIQADSIIVKEYKDFVESTHNDSINLSSEKINRLRSALIDKLYYSKARGFVVWRIKQDYVYDHIPFRSLSRKFALDTDLIVCTFREGMFSYIVGREREIPVTILPPLRSETIASLASLTGFEQVLFYPDSAIVIKDSLNNDSVWATSITMSDRLQNTELGNLMVLSDMMLKSWSENAKVNDFFIDYPQPRSFFTKEGVAKELGYAPQYIWRDFPFDYKHKTGCQNLHYYTRGDSIPEKNSTDLVFRATDYFSSLNNTDLVRVKQYSIMSWALIHPWRFLSFAESNSWLQTPSTTVSNCPWGYGGCMLQVPVIVNTARKALERLTYRGFEVPAPLMAIASQGSLPSIISVAIQNEEKSLKIYENTQKAYSKNLTTSEQLNLIRKNYEESRNKLIKALSLYKERLLPATKESLINPKLKYIGRGFVPEVHNIAPTTIIQEKNVISENLQNTVSSSKWKERLRERVKNKIHKINTKQTKGGIYMIYGYILNLNDNGEYLTNYAA